jgi:hypothetical protein
MESLARAFDQPIDSPEHRELAEYGWIGGEFVTVRYWLGRLLERNLFRETDPAVATLLREYLITRGCQAATALVAELQCWGPLVVLLRSDWESAAGVPITGNRRRIEAIRAIIGNPELTNKELADLANTTEKQVSRMADITVVRKAWRSRQSTRSSKLSD